MSKKEQFNSYVDPRTAEFARQERESTGRSIGAIVDLAMDLYSMKELHKIRYRLQERLNTQKLTDEDIDELVSLKNFLDLVLKQLG